MNEILNTITIDYGSKDKMDEQKEIVTSFDPKTGKSTEVNVVLDHVRSGGMDTQLTANLKKQPPKCKV